MVSEITDDMDDTSVANLYLAATALVTNAVIHGPPEPISAVVQQQGDNVRLEVQGQKVGPGEWREVTQQMINTFAELSGDQQWIHGDGDRAKKESPFGTTVAHGNLTRSLIDGFRLELIESSGFVLGVNYGW